MCVCVLRGVCNRDQEKVNYLLVLRCRLASPGWAGSSGERSKGRKREGREGKSQVSMKTITAPGTICKVEGEQVKCVSVPGEFVLLCELNAKIKQ